MRSIQLSILALLALVISAGCATTQQGMAPPTYTKAMTVTAYCKCGKCCNWHRNWFFKPVIASGPNKGVPKKVGVTASGTKAHPGTIAADTKKYPFGTVMYIPGYGYGTVEDRGGAIVGEHIDIYFKRHRQALQWGRVKENVSVWLPGSSTQARNNDPHP